MTVENTNSTISYVGNNSQVNFSYNFLVYRESDLFVYLDGVEQASGYTVTGIGDENGGSITFTVAPGESVTVTIDRTVPLTQEIEYQEYGPFPAKTNERGLDLGTMADQQLQRDVSRAREGKMDKIPSADAFNIVIFDDEGNSYDSGIPISGLDPNFDGTFKKRAVIISPGQTIITVTDDFNSAIVVIDGDIQLETSGAYAVNIETKEITMSEPFIGTETVELWVNYLFVEPATETQIGKFFDTVDEALNYVNLQLNDVINIKQLVTEDNSLFIWDVVLTSSITPDLWGKRTTVTNPALSIVLRGADDYIFRKQFDPAKIIAHRGYLFSAAAENTVGSISSAWIQGADGVEFDMQADADGEIWCFHDPNLSPDTQLSGSFNASTTAYIETAIYNSSAGTRYGGIGLTKLKDMLEYCRGRKLFIHPEMKWTWTEANMDTVMGLFRSYGYDNNKCYLSDVDVEHLRYIRSISPNIKVVYGFNLTFAEAKPGIDVMYELGNSAINWNYTALFNDPEFFTYCAERNIEITGWVVNDVEVAHRLRAQGVTTLICDVPLGDLL